MGDTVTVRLDPETCRILRELTRRNNGSKSRAVREALRAHWETVAAGSAPTAWEVYSSLKIPKGRPKRDRAQHVSRLLKEILLAKRRRGTL